jgi:hypothetical protein
MSDAKKSKARTETIEIDEKGQESKKAEEKKPVKAIAIKNESRWKRFSGWYKTNKKQSVPLSLLLLLVVLAAIPMSRYALAGMVLKNNFSALITDSTTGTPVSGADVNLGSVHGLTDANGKVTLKNVSVGQQQLVIVKKYYSDKSADVLVPISKQKSVSKFQMAAIGRQVKINVKDAINHEILADTNIKVAGVSAKTDKTGSAIVVLPAGTSSEKATVSLDGYNNSDVTVLVDNKTIKENNFNLTPSGKVYFLSKLSGKIDVVKTNLDGTSRQTILAGTGKEDSNNTVLLASRDWKYLALLSKREGGKNPKLYLIETSTDKLTTIDEGDISISLVGWSDNNFIYQISRNSVNYWEAKRQAIKSYNAQNKQVVTLDQTDAIISPNSGNPPAGFAYEQFGSNYIFGNTLAYTKQWYKSGWAYYDQSIIGGKSSGLFSIKSDGTSRKSLKTIDANSVSYITFQFSEPDEAYLTINKNDNTISYAIYNGSGVSDVSADKIPSENQYETYLASPSGDQTFWSESRDGKNTLCIGDDKGGNGKQIASLADYKPYGWFTDKYLLVSKNSSELYIIPKSGITEKTPPLKITDYHKSVQNFYGYGGGYGGI